MHRAKYKEARNKINSEYTLSRSKISSVKLKIKGCALAKDPEQSWMIINELLGKTNKANNVSQLEIDESIISGDIKIAESLNDYFVSIGTKLASEIVNSSTDPNR